LALTCALVTVTMVNTPSKRRRGQTLEVPFMSMSPGGLQCAIDRLRSLHDGDLAITDVVAYGKDAIQPLREALFQREPSGLFDARCRVVETLATIGAYDVLIEFLSAPHAVGDPVESVGEDAVVNAAALAFVRQRDERVYPILLRLAERPCLTGVIAALGAFGRTDAIPRLVDALAEDASRRTAEAALGTLGAAAHRSLLDAAILPSSSETDIRRLVSVLGVLAEIGTPSDAWPTLSPLVDHPNPRIAVSACRACLATAPRIYRRAAARRLVDQLSTADWTLHDEIENCLITYFPAARDIIEDTVKIATLHGKSTDGKTVSTLLRVISRAKTPEYGDLAQPPTRS
jgi:HEAT repeat protein